MEQRNVAVKYTFTFAYPHSRGVTQQQPLNEQSEKFEMGQTDNELFYRFVRHGNFASLKEKHPEIENLLDSNGNNILHYAAFQHDEHLVKEILGWAESKGTLEKLVNQRNKDGTKPLGMAFLFASNNNSKGIRIAASIPPCFPYKFNDYLSNKNAAHRHVNVFKEIAKMTIIDCVIDAASRCDDESIDDVKRFFEVLHHNPNFTKIRKSTKMRLKEVKFQSKNMEDLILDKVPKQQYSDDEVVDNDGDSDGEDSGAYLYKSMLKECQNFIKKDLGLQGCDKFFEKYQEPKELDDALRVPLFHGMPFKTTWCSDSERRFILKGVAEINRKLLNDESFSEADRVRSEVHSRTAILQAGMKNLFDIMQADKERLEKLSEAENQLMKYFSGTDPKETKAALYEFVFNYNNSQEGSKNFWDKLSNKTSYFGYPVVPTSKTPDHALRFAAGCHSGKDRLQPNYQNGTPTHRVAGLLYVTLHPLKEIKKKKESGLLFDVNQFFDKEGNDRFKQQIEVDFLGKLDNVVCIIPIVYPNLQDKQIQDKQIQDKQIQDDNLNLYGLTLSDKKMPNNNPSKLLKKVQKQGGNPVLLNDSPKLVGLGVPLFRSAIYMAHGVIEAIAHKNNWTLCSITEDGKTVGYDLGFDRESGCTSVKKKVKHLTKNERSAPPMAPQNLLPEFDAADTPDKEASHEDKVRNGDTELPLDNEEPGDKLDKAMQNLNINEN